MIFDNLYLFALLSLLISSIYFEKTDIFSTVQVLWYVYENSFRNKSKLQYYNAIKCDECLFAAYENEKRIRFLLIN